MKYVCKDCGRIFDESEIVTYTESYGERFTVSPCCNEEFYEADMCEKCGEWVDPLEMNGNICKDCEEELVEEAKKILHQRFTKEELDVIFDHVDEL